MDLVASEVVKNLRGQILRTVYDNHRAQREHLRLVPLAGFLEKLYYDIGLNDLITVLQDLKDRKYLDFSESKDRWTRKVEIGRIAITPAGRDLVEGTTSDKAVSM